MSDTFENLSYSDVARNFAIELEFKNPPIFWVIDGDDEGRDRELKKKRVQYYLTQHIGELKSCK